jgi:hypothetical protein
MPRPDFMPICINVSELEGVGNCSPNVELKQTSQIPDQPTRIRTNRGIPVPLKVLLEMPVPYEILQSRERFRSRLQHTDERGHHGNCFSHLDSHDDHDV